MWRIGAYGLVTRQNKLFCRPYRPAKKSREKSPKTPRCPLSGFRRWWTGSGPARGPPPSSGASWPGRTTPTGCRDASRACVTSWRCRPRTSTASRPSSGRAARGASATTWPQSSPQKSSCAWGYADILSDIWVYLGSLASFICCRL